MKSFLPHPFQVKAALEGRLKVLIQLVKPQPDRFINNVDGSPQPILKCRSKRPAIYGGVDAEGNDFDVRAPYPPDSLIYLREAIYEHYFVTAGEWSLLTGTTEYEWSPKGTFTYAADGEPQCDYKKRSAATMPQAAARIYLKPEESYPKRVQEVTEEEAEWFGVDLIDYYLKATHDDIPYAAYSYKEALQSFWMATKPEIWDRNCWIWLTPVSVISTNGKPE